MAAFDLKKALELAVQVLSKSMDSTNLSSEKLEFATVTRNEAGDVVFSVMSRPDIDALIANTNIDAEGE